MARGVPGGGGGLEDRRKDQERRACTEATDRHPVSLLLGPAFPALPGVQLPAEALRSPAAALA